MNEIINHIIRTQTNDDTVKLLHKALFAYLCFHSVPQSNVCISCIYNLRDICHIQRLSVYVPYSWTQTSLTFNSISAEVVFYPTHYIPQSHQFTSLGIPYENVSALLKKGTYEQLLLLYNGLTQKTTKRLRTTLCIRSANNMASKVRQTLRNHAQEQQI